MDSLNQTLRDPLLGTNPSFFKFGKHMRMELSHDNIQGVFVTFFGLIKKKNRYSSTMMGKLREGNYISFVIMTVFSHLCVSQKYTPPADRICFPSLYGLDLEQNKNTKC